LDGAVPVASYLLFQTGIDKISLFLVRELMNFYNKIVILILLLCILWQSLASEAMI
jgi:hypothetical protein